MRDIIPQCIHLTEPQSSQNHMGGAPVWNTSHLGKWHILHVGRAPVWSTSHLSKWHILHIEGAPVWSTPHLSKWHILHIGGAPVWSTSHLSKWHLLLDAVPCGSDPEQTLLPWGIHNITQPGITVTACLITIHIPNVDTNFMSTRFCMDATRHGMGLVGHRVSNVQTMGERLLIMLISHLSHLQTMQEMHLSTIQDIDAPAPKTMLVLRMNIPLHVHMKL